MMNTLRDRIGALWRRIERAGTQKRSVLVISTASTLQTEIHIWSIRERWRTVHTRSLAAALQVLSAQQVAVVLYDQDLPDADWRAALQTLTSRASNTPFLILLARAAGAKSWKLLLDAGGYDLVNKPVERGELARVVNSAFDLADSIDASAQRPAPTLA
jgi:DNA-binding response OmpR family regulator